MDLGDYFGIVKMVVGVVMMRIVSHISFSYVLEEWSEYFCFYLLFIHVFWKHCIFLVILLRLDTFSCNSCKFLKVNCRARAFLVHLCCTGYIVGVLISTCTLFIKRLIQCNDYLCKVKKTCIIV